MSEVNWEAVWYAVVCTSACAVFLLALVIDTNGE